jgi:hypothetical protein
LRGITKIPTPEEMKSARVPEDNSRRKTNLSLKLILITSFTKQIRTKFKTNGRE